MTPCNLKGCPLPGQHISDCEPTHAGKVTYWGERALVLRNSMERDGLSLEEIGRIFVGAAPTLRPPPMLDPAQAFSRGYREAEAEAGRRRLDELESRDVSADLKPRGGNL